MTVSTSFNADFKLVRDQCGNQDRQISAHCTYLVIHQIDPKSNARDVGASELAFLESWE
jgi:hypothetical protein